MKNYMTHNQNIDDMVREMEVQLDTLSDIVDIRITEEFGLNTSIKRELSSMSYMDIDTIKTETDVQQIIERSLDGSLEDRRKEALQCISNMRQNYNSDSEWKDKEFVEYIRNIFTTIKDALKELEEFKSEKSRIQHDVKNASKKWFEYITSPEYKEKKLQEINNMKIKLEKEEDPNEKRKLSRSIEQMESSESLSFLFSRLEKNPEAESGAIKDSYFDQHRSKTVMSKFRRRIVGFGYNADIYKRFFNLEEMFLPDEYKDLNNIFLYCVMRFISYADIYNERDKMYVSSLLVKMYNLIYHKYDNKEYEDEFIDIIKRIDDYFMPYIEEFREKNITSPNHPIRKRRDEAYDQKIRIMLIAQLQDAGVDVDTSLSTEELRKMFNDVVAKKNENKDDAVDTPMETPDPDGV